MTIPKALADALSGTGVSEAHAAVLLELLSTSLGWGETSDCASRFTPDGGFAIRLLNGTGVPSVRGSVVSVDRAAEGGFVLAPADSFDPFGVVYENGAAAGQPTWVVVGGIAHVLLEDGTAAVHGNWVKVSASAPGRAYAEASTPPVTGLLEQIVDHFREVGHCLQSRIAGVGVLSRCVLHFN